MVVEVAKKKMKPSIIIHQSTNFCLTVSFRSKHPYLVLTKIIYSNQKYAHTYTQFNAKAHQFLTDYNLYGSNKFSSSPQTYFFFIFFYFNIFHLFKKKEKNSELYVRNFCVPRITSCSCYYIWKTFFLSYGGVFIFYAYDLKIKYGKAFLICVHMYRVIHFVMDL